MHFSTYQSPIGPLTVVVGRRGIRSIYLPGETPRLAESERRPMPAVAERLDSYFAGQPEAFDLELDPPGSPLQKLVWKQLREIPYGVTTSYGEVAGRIDASHYPEDLEPYLRPRLVGAAVGRNPIPIVIACHRVIGADGSLTGFRGGLALKRALLELEGWSEAPKAASKSAGADPQLPLL